jgi:hypothetical protein
MVLDLSSAVLSARRVAALVSSAQAGRGRVKNNPPSEMGSTISTLRSVPGKLTCRVSRTR